MTTDTTPKILGLSWLESRIVDRLREAGPMKAHALTDAVAEPQTKYFPGSQTVRDKLKALEERGVIMRDELGYWHLIR